jgi:hypothetical protein
MGGPRRCFHTKVPSKTGKSWYCYECNRARHGYKGYLRGKPTKWPLVEAFVREWGIVTSRDVRKLTGWGTNASCTRLGEWSKASPPKLRALGQGVYALPAKEAE